MLKKESEWIKKQIESLELLSLKKFILNIGSSTKEFNDTQQPYLKYNVLEPLGLIGQVVNVDIKDAPGVDLVANFYETSGREMLKNFKPDLILVSNLLEHLENPDIALKYLTDILSPGGLLMLTGPKRFPYHPDPIDNRFRPSKSKLRRMLSKDFEILELKIVCAGSVLTATSDSKKDSYEWLAQKAKNFSKDPKGFFKTLNHALTPASAFCCLARKNKTKI